MTSTNKRYVRRTLAALAAAAFLAAGIAAPATFHDVKVSHTATFHDVKVKAKPSTFHDV